MTGLPLCEDAIPAVFPHKFGRYRLLKFLGQGWESCVYLAAFWDPATKPEYMPSAFALKLAVDRSRLYVPETGWRSLEDLQEAFLQQHEFASRIQHPLIARVFSEVTPQGQRCYEHVSEAGLLSLARLQELVGSGEAVQQGISEGLAVLHDYEVHEGIIDKARSGALPFAMVKYLAAQLVTVMDFLHQSDQFWGDPTQNNIIIMSDFSIRIIDMHTSKGNPNHKKRDIEMLAGLLYNLTTGDPDFLCKDSDWLSARFQEQHAERPLFYDLLKKLLAERSCASIRSHPFWSADTEAAGVDMATPCAENMSKALQELKVAACKSVDGRVRDALTALGIRYFS